MSAGKPLGSRAALLLDLDFSFLRRARKAETQGQRSPPLARGCSGAQTAPEELFPFLSPRGPAGCARASLFPFLFGHLSNCEAKLQL